MGFIEMGVIIGYLIITAVFGGIFLLVAYIESFLVATGIFASAIALAGLVALAEHLIRVG